MAISFQGWRTDYGIPTPEMGLTEAAARLLGSPLNSQGGSNLFGTNNQQASTTQPTQPTYHQQYDSPAGPQQEQGDILGASTGNTTNRTSSTPTVTQTQNNNQTQQISDQRNAVSSQEDVLRDTIASGFNQLRSGMGNLIPNYEALRDQLIQDAQGGFNTFQGDVEGFRQNTKDLVAQRTDTAKQNLSQNVRDMMRANALQLGALSPNSSASSTMSPYAFQKIANKEMGNIEGQATESLLQAKQTYDEMIATAQANMTAKISDVKERYGQAIIQIRDRIVQADAQEAQALANLEQQILDEARNQLAMFEQNFYNEQQAIKQWTLNQVAQLDDMRLQGANYDPGEITFNRLDMAGIDPQGIGGDFYNPMALAQKKREELGLN